VTTGISVVEGAGAFDVGEFDAEPVHREAGHLVGGGGAREHFHHIIAEHDGGHAQGEKQDGRAHP
jgi:hypothetical protein